MRECEGYLGRATARHRGRAAAAAEAAWAEMWAKDPLNPEVSLPPTPQRHRLEIKRESPRARSGRRRRAGR
jgi:hypothetical protein